MAGGRNRVMPYLLGITAAALSGLCLWLPPAYPNRAERRGRSTLHGRMKKSSASSPLTVSTVDDGYDVSARDFSFHLTGWGELKSIRHHGEPVIERAYLEVRGPTWHTKLYARDAQFSSQRLKTGSDRASFAYTVKMDDDATAIHLTTKETLLVTSGGDITITLMTIPRSSFLTRRISFNLELDSARYGARRFTCFGADHRPVSAEFPRDRAVRPQITTDIASLRLEPKSGDLSMVFQALDNHKKQLPPQNVLEDLRWWNLPLFWVADAVPYASTQPAGVDLPVKVSAGDTRTVRIKLQLREKHRA